jgi:hypothetical protein
MSAKRNALDQIRRRVSPERDDAVRMTRCIRRDLAKLEASLRAADMTQRAHVQDVGRKRARLQQAGLELIGLGMADQQGSQRHNRARFEVILAVVVQHAAASFVADCALEVGDIPDPNRRPKPALGAYPEALCSMVNAQLDAMLRYLPDLATSLLPVHTTVAEHLVYATAVRALALRAGKERSNYLDWVVRALMKGKISSKPNVARLKQLLRRHG